MRAGVHEAYKAGYTLARRVIQEFDVLCRKGSHLGAYVGRREAEVVQALTAALDETADAVGVIERLDELEFAVCEMKKRYFDALILDSRAAVQRQAEAARVERDTGLEVTDRDSNVVQALRRCRHVVYRHETLLLTAEPAQQQAGETEQQQAGHD